MESKRTAAASVVREKPAFRRATNREVIESYRAEAFRTFFGSMLAAPRRANRNWFRFPAHLVKDLSESRHRQ